MAKANFKKSDEEAEDRLSALHDSLLHQILSLLDTKEVMRTCVLSKRWQFLWTDSSSLVLQDTSEDAASFRFSVRRILVLCAGIHLNKLCIEFMYNPRSAESVTLWIEFAIKNRIKDFTLLLRSIEHYYELPQIFYSNSSLTALTIGSCRIAPRGSIEWRFLKHLNIVNAEVLLEDLVQNILSGCPVLEILQLTKCRGYGFLKVCSPNLTTLVIDGWRNRTNNDRSLMISAPNLHVLSVSDERPTWCFVAGDFSSLVKAKVDYNLARSDVVLKQVASMQYPNVKQSLESFSSVKELELGPWCIEVLSRLEEKGLRLSSSTRLRLTLTVWRHRTSIGGILNILKSSPNLEMLVIKGIDFKHILIWDNQLQDDSWYLVLRALKTVNISGLSGEPMLTLVQLLLKSATNLEKMVIDATTSTSYSSATPCSLEFSKFKRKLFSFPRSSPKAIVVVR